jgi:hypothetical protein
MTESDSSRTPDPGDQLQVLHQELFGFTPAKPWQAYERLTAVVLAVLGWTAVKQQSHERRTGARALQRLDVVARHPSGEQRRLIVQCKQYGKTVEKEEVDTLIGVGKQVGDVDLALVTTKGFTSGACDAAVDEDVAMVVLRPYDETSEQANFVRAIHVTLNFLGPPIVTNFSVELGATEGPVQNGTLQTNTLQVLERGDGTPGETLAELMGRSRPGEAGEFDQRLELPDARWLRVPGGRVQIHAITWHEKMEQGSHTFSIEAKGEPKLVIQQLDDDLNPSSGRLVVDQDLYAWDLDDDNNVVPRGQLEGPASDASAQTDGS